MATRVGVMRDGRILQVGTPRTVYDRPANMFVARFVGSPGMNLIHGRLACGDGAVAFRAGPMSLPLGTYAWAEPPVEGRAAVLGVRSEDVGTPDGSQACTVVATPVLIQPTGSDTLVHFALAGAEVTARLHRDHDAVVGRPMTLGVQVRDVSVFCPVGGHRL